MNNKRITGTRDETAFSLASIYVQTLLFDTTFLLDIKFQEMGSIYLHTLHICTILGSEYNNYRSSYDIGKGARKGNAPPIHECI